MRSQDPSVASLVSCVVGSGDRVHDGPADPAAPLLASVCIESHLARLPFLGHLSHVFAVLIYQWRWQKEMVGESLGMPVSKTLFLHLWGLSWVSCLEARTETSCRLQLVWSTCTPWAQAVGCAVGLGLQSSDLEVHTDCTRLQSGRKSASPLLLLICRTVWLLVWVWYVLLKWQNLIVCPYGFEKFFKRSRRNTELEMQQLIKGIIWPIRLSEFYIWEFFYFFKL